MCEICRRFIWIREGNNPYFVRGMETGYIVIEDHQHFYGYTLFLYRNHATQLNQLDKDVKKKFLYEMSLVAEATASAFHVEKMNYELLGNDDSHLHWHLFPRREGDLDGYGNNGRGPVWWSPAEKIYYVRNRPSDEELAFMRRRNWGKMLKKVMKRENC